jgi:elongation factor G
MVAIKKRDLANLRNIGVAAHIDAGKTTVSERILYYAGKEHQLGEVDDGTATMDWMEEEQERGITITSAATSILWRDCHINLIDTPGHVDFTAEVERCMRVLDGVIVVFDAVSGVEAQSETVWRQADRYRVPRLAFVNKMDRVGASFEQSVASMRRRLQAPAVPIQLPIGSDKSFAGCIDLVGMETVRWTDDLGLCMERDQIPAELQPAALQARAFLVEKAAEFSDSIMEAFVEGQPVTVEELRGAIRAGTIRGQLVPVLCGSALHNRGVQPLLDAVIDYLPSPLDLPPVEGIDPEQPDHRIVRRGEDSEPLAALVFKVQSDSHGELYFLRIYSGVLEAGGQVHNSRTGKPERIGRLVMLHANERTQVESARAGEIVAAIGLRQARTGDTLHERGQAISLEPIRFPEPVISMAIEPKSNADRDKLAAALEVLVKEDRAAVAWVFLDSAR